MHTLELCSDLNALAHFVWVPMPAFVAEQSCKPLAAYVQLESERRPDTQKLDARARSTRTQLNLGTRE